jgi:uncharacterized protein YwgA
MNMVSEDVNQLVLLVLELAGGRIITDTRMQKLAFLVNQEVFKWVKFEANDYGPYSEELMKAVYKLEKEGKLIYVWDNDGLSKYYLTEKGKLEAKNLLEQLKAEDKDKLNRAMEIIQRHKVLSSPHTGSSGYGAFSKFQLGRGKSRNIRYVFRIERLGK